MSSKSYGLFCPLAMACEVIEPRWTLLILAEMWDGSTRFNDIRRGVPGISPTLLAKRLRDLENRGLVERIEDAAKGTVDYIRTPKAIELESALTLLGDWAYRHVEANIALHDVNPDYLMWQMRRTIDASALPQRRVVVRFHFADLKEDESTYWMIARPGAAVDLCMSDPHFEVDLFHRDGLSDHGLRMDGIFTDEVRDRPRPYPAAGRRTAGEDHRALAGEVPLRGNRGDDSVGL